MCGGQREINEYYKEYFISLPFNSFYLFYTLLKVYLFSFFSYLFPSQSSLAVNSIESRSKDGSSLQVREGQC